MKKTIKQLWSDFGDIPISNGGRIEESFLHFKKGIHREKVWKWFDTKYIGGVYKLMFKN